MSALQSELDASHSKGEPMASEREEIRGKLYAEWVEGGGSINRWQQLNAQVDAGIWDGYLNRFPDYAMLFIANYVGRWFIHVMMRDTGDIVMMYPCASYEEALAFLKAHANYELTSERY